MTGPRRRVPLRLRITAGALVVVVGALTAGGLVVIGVVEGEMTSQIDSALRADADFTERMITSGSGLPVEEGPTDLYVQFLDETGTVVGAGTAAAGRPALTASRQANGSIVTVTDPELGELRVLATSVPNNPRLTLVFARSSQNVAAVQESLIRLLGLLVAGGSVLLSVLVWLVVGRSLRPVEQMRRTVEGVDDGDLHTRVAMPGTGDELDRCWSGTAAGRLCATAPGSPRRSVPRSSEAWMGGVNDGRDRDRAVRRALRRSGHPVSWRRSSG